MDKKQDPKTAKILRNNKLVSDTLSSEGWQIIKSELYKEIIDMESIFSVSRGTPETMMIELRASQIAIEKLQNWLYNIEGTALSANQNEYKSFKEKYIFSLDD